MTQTPLVKPTRRRYTKPPIVESVLEIRFVSRAALTVGDLRALFKAVPGDWIAAPDVTLHKVFIPPPTAQGATISEPIGVRFDSADKKWVILLRQDVFSLSRLEPYDSWENLLEMAGKVCHSLRLAERITSVGRIALRTINRLDLPLPMSDFRTYLRTSPEVSPDLPQMLSSVFMNLVLPEVGVDVSATIIEATVQASKPNTAAMILDIDVFQERNLSPALDFIWQRFGELHDCRNALFEGCITDATRDLFK
jgi:uncharacterized protein (TIGR04255 family)